MADAESEGPVKRPTTKRRRERDEEGKAAACEREAPDPQAKRKRSMTLPEGEVGDAVLLLLGAFKQVQENGDNAATTIKKQKNTIAKKKAEINRLVQQHQETCEGNIVLKQSLDDITEERDVFAVKLDQLKKRLNEAPPLARLPEVSTLEEVLICNETQWLAKQHKAMTREIEKHRDMTKEIEMWTDEHMLLSWDYAEEERDDAIIIQDLKSKITELEASKAKVEECDKSLQDLKGRLNQLRIGRDRFKDENVQLNATVEALRQQLRDIKGGQAKRLKAKDAERAKEQGGQATVLKGREEEKVKEQPKTPKSGTNGRGKEERRVQIGDTKRNVYTIESDDSDVEISGTKGDIPTFGWAELEFGYQVENISDKYNKTKGYHIVIQHDGDKTITLFWPHAMKDGSQTTTRNYNMTSEEVGFEGQSYTDMFDQFELCTIPTKLLTMVQKAMRPGPKDAARNIIVKFAALADYKEHLSKLIPGSPKRIPEADSMFSSSQERDDGYSSEEEEEEFDPTTPKSGRSGGTCTICATLSGNPEMPRVCPASIALSKEKGTRKGCPFRLPNAGPKQLARVEEMLQEFSEKARKYYKHVKDTAIEDAKGQYDANYQRSLGNQRK